MRTNDRTRRVGTVQGMIGYLNGTARGTDLVVCGGVGYRVTTPEPLVDGAVVELHVVPVVREDAFDLFGFPDPGQEALFRALIRASGVGPKLALGLISHLGAAEAARAVAAGDTVALARCPGVGVKLAQKLCVSITISEELLAVLGAPNEAAEAVVAEADDVIAAALITLGYGGADAARAANAARAAHPDTDDEGRLVRAALAILV